MEKEYLKRIIEEEKTLTGLDHNGIDTEKGHEVKKGTAPVLISAMVGVKHERKIDGEIQKNSAHIYTASLAEEVSRKARTSSIIKTKHLPSDLGKVTNEDYKSDIIKLIQEENICFFMDLRGSIKNQKSGIIIGDGDEEYIYGNTEFREKTKELFESFGISVKFSPSCQAKKKSAPANYVFRNTGVPSVQLLINKNLREPKKDLCSFLMLSDALTAYSLLALKYFNNKNLETDVEVVESYIDKQIKNETGNKLM